MSKKEFEKTRLNIIHLMIRCMAYAASGLLYVLILYSAARHNTLLITAIIIPLIMWVSAFIHEIGHGIILLTKRARLLSLDVCGLHLALNQDSYKLNIDFSDLSSDCLICINNNHFLYFLIYLLGGILNTLLFLIASLIMLFKTDDILLHTIFLLCIVCNTNKLIINCIPILTDNKLNDISSIIICHRHTNYIYSYLNMCRTLHEGNFPADYVTVRNEYYLTQYNNDIIKTNYYKALSSTDYNCASFYLNMYNHDDLFFITEWAYLNKKYDSLPRLKKLGLHQPPSVYRTLLLSSVCSEKKHIVKAFYNNLWKYPCALASAEKELFTNITDDTSE